jgi:hypothetical protein
VIGGRLDHRALTLAVLRISFRHADGKCAVETGLAKEWSKTLDELLLIMAQAI